MTETERLDEENTKLVCDKTDELILWLNENIAWSVNYSRLNIIINVLVNTQVSIIAAMPDQIRETFIEGIYQQIKDNLENIRKLERLGK